MTPDPPSPAFFAAWREEKDEASAETRDFPRIQLSCQTISWKESGLSAKRESPLAVDSRDPRRRMAER